MDELKKINKLLAEVEQKIDYIYKTTERTITFNYDELMVNNRSFIINFIQSGNYLNLELDIDSLSKCNTQIFLNDVLSLEKNGKFLNFKFTQLSRKIHRLSIVLISLGSIDSVRIKLTGVGVKSV